MAFHISTSIGMDNQPVELALLWHILASFDAEQHEDNFLVLENDTPIEGSLYLQSALNSDPGEAKRYIVETRIVNDDDTFAHYQWETDQLSQVQALFADYYLRKQRPNVSEWDDITAIFM